MVPESLSIEPPWTLPVSMVTAESLFFTLFFFFLGMTSRRSVREASLPAMAPFLRAPVSLVAYGESLPKSGNGLRVLAVGPERK